MKKATVIKTARLAWQKVSNARSEFIRVLPCDPRSLAGLKADSDSPPFASIRVMRGQYTWSIPVRMFGAIERTSG